jgi:Icc-related predicted phosphoesterase
MTCVRVAAVGDIHVGPDSDAVLHAESLADTADVLLVAGDLTRHGTPSEAKVLAAEVATAPVPVVVVLGNHDFESDAAHEVRAVMESAGATVLDGDSVEVQVGDVRVGIAGTPGFGGGFRGASCSEFGEPLMKAFVRQTRAMADALCHSLSGLETHVRIAMTHYSPIEATLEGERLEIYPFLGSYLLAEAIDTGGAHLAIHGHAHRGSRAGVTPCGVPVRNVARPVIGRPFTVLRLDANGLAQDREPEHRAHKPRI